MRWRQVQRMSNSSFPFAVCVTQCIGVRATCGTSVIEASGRYQAQQPITHYLVSEVGFILLHVSAHVEAGGRTGLPGIVTGRHSFGALDFS